MTGKELKSALLQRSPVTFNGIGYAYTSAIIYRAVEGQIKVTVELMDCNQNCVVIADPNKITVKEPDE